MVSFNNIYAIFYYKYKHNHIIIITIYNIKNFHVRKSIQKRPKSSPGHEWIYDIQKAKTGTPAQLFFNFSGK